MGSYRYLHLDVFTGRLFGGNQLAVFLDGRGLDTRTMQNIAGEMNFSESTFVLPAEAPGTDLRVRIFTPREELPMAGHPTIGTAFALARAGALAAGRERVVFGLGVGPTDVSLEWRDDGLAFAWMTQRPPIFGDPLTDRSGVAALLGLKESGIASDLPVQTVSCGVPYLVVPLASRCAVDDASMELPALARFAGARALESPAVYLFSTEPGDDGADAYCRMFAPGLGIQEDPATGSAAGPLGCYLVQHRPMKPEGARTMLLRQGVRMGRPSDMHVSIGVTGGAISDVRVGGTAVLAGEGTLFV